MKETPEIKHIIWDADNTIWNWVKYAVKAYPEMARIIALKTDKAEKTVISAMKAFYTRAQTMENPWLIQGLQEAGFFKDTTLNQEDIEELRTIVQEAFTKTRYQNLKCYPEIPQIIKLAKERGIKNHIVTDAPRFQAEQRIKFAKIYDDCESFHACEYPQIITEFPPDIIELTNNGKYDIPFIVHKLESEKPDTRLEDIIKIIGNTHEYIRRHIAIIGDNDQKDMEIARRYGCLGIHALWGLATPEEIAILKQFAPEKVARRNLSLVKPISEETGNIIQIGQNAIYQKVTKELGIAA